MGGVVVSEPDPREKNRKEGLGGSVSLIPRPPCQNLGVEAWEQGYGSAEVYCVPGMQARFHLVHDCILMCIYWKYKPQPASTVQGDRK